MDKIGSQGVTDERVVWSAFPSWAQFTWLYFFSLMAGLRGLAFFRVGASGWQTWIGGAAMLILCVAVLRHWGEYLLTWKRIIVRNGFTGRDIHSLALEHVATITVSQGPIARFFDIGTLVIHSVTGQEAIKLRGIPDPEALRIRILAMRPPVRNVVAEGSSVVNR